MKESTFPDRRLTGFPLAAALLASASVANAAWELVPDVALSVNSNDNILLDPVFEQSASRMLLDATATFTNFTERGNIYVAPRVVADSYSEDTAKVYESENYYLDAGGQYDWQTAGLGFRTRYTERLILDSEFAALAPEDPNIDLGDEFVDPDTGRLTVSLATRETLDFRSNYDVRASQRDTFRFDFARQDVSYSATDTPQWSNYDNNTLGVGYIRQLAPRSNASIFLTASEFNAERDNNSSDSVGIQIRYVRPLSQTWTLNLNAGYERSDYQFVGTGNTPVQDTSSNPTFGMSLRKRAQRSLWNLDLLHTVQPNGSGFLVERSNANAYVTYDFSPRMTGRFALRYTSTATLDDLRASDDRNYLRMGFELEWAIRQTLFLNFTLEQLAQEFVNETDGEATRNSVYVGLTYRGRSRQDAL